ncbi:hypothetical protein ABTZ46_17700 [Nocardioides sp. NPDC126508]
MSNAPLELIAPAAGIRHHRPVAEAIAMSEIDDLSRYQNGKVRRRVVQGHHTSDQVPPGSTNDRIVTWRPDTAHS